MPTQEPNPTPPCRLANLIQALTTFFRKTIHKGNILGIYKEYMGPYRAHRAPWGPFGPMGPIGPTGSTRALPVVFVLFPGKVTVFWKWYTFMKWSIKLQKKHLLSLDYFSVWRILSGPVCSMDSLHVFLRTTKTLLSIRFQCRQKHPRYLQWSLSA